MMVVAMIWRDNIRVNIHWCKQQIPTLSNLSQKRDVWGGSQCWRWFRSQGRLNESCSHELSTLMFQDPSLFDSNVCVSPLKSQFLEKRWSNWPILDHILSLWPEGENPVIGSSIKTTEDEKGVFPPKKGILGGQNNNNRGPLESLTNPNLHTVMFPNIWLLLVSYESVFLFAYACSPWDAMRGIVHSLQTLP